MKLQLCLVLLFLYLKGSYSTISSYPSPGDEYIFLCGCASRNQYNTSIQIKCRDDHVLQIEPYIYVMRESVGGNNDCGQFNFTTCENLRPDYLNLENRIEIYKKCTFKNSCDINIAGVEEGKQRLVNYPFYCHSDKTFHDISVKKYITQSKPNIYFIGENHTGQKIDCDCFVTGSDTIRIEIVFLHLKPTSCSKVKILYGNIKMFECPTDDLIRLHVRYISMNKQFKLEIRDLQPDKEDVLFFRLWGSNLSVNCTGCTESKDDLSTTTATSSMDATVSTEHPSTTGYDNNDNYPALFGGILAAVIIIINIVGIGIYCYIRKRKKRKSVPNEPIPPVLSSNEYADFHHPTGTDHHYQELMDYQNVTRQNTPTGPES